MSKTAIEHAATTQAIELHEWLEAKRAEHDLHAVSFTCTAASYDQAGKYSFRVYLHHHQPGRSNMCECGDGPTMSDAFDEAFAKLIEQL